MAQSVDTALTLAHLLSNPREFRFFFSCICIPETLLHQLSTWAGLTSTVYFVLAAVHSIPHASLAKPTSGPLSLPTWAEKLQVLMFGLAWSLSVRFVLL